MTLKIVDASVAIKWFVDEPKREGALEILKQIERSPREFAVPELFFNEMLAVLCRLLTHEKLIRTYVGTLEDIGFHRIGNGHELLQKAVSLSKDFQLTGYDAVYAATAELTSGLWLTADKVAHNKIAKRRISQFIQ